jgi:hypothetical protein
VRLCGGIDNSLIKTGNYDCVHGHDARTKSSVILFGELIIIMIEPNAYLKHGVITLVLWY